MGTTRICTSVPACCVQPQHSDCAVDSMAVWKDRSGAEELKIVIDSGSQWRRGKKMGFVSEVC